MRWLLRYTYRLIYLAVFITVAGCSNEQSRSRILDKIERQVNIAPFSTIARLDSIDADRLSEGNRALYMLLRAESLHRLNLPQDPVGTLDESIRHFRTYGDKGRTARSMLHHGIALYEHNRYREAVSVILEASEMARDTVAPFLKFYINESLGRINRKKGSDQKALQYYRMALHHARYCADEDLRVSVINSITDIFDYLNMPDSMAMYISRIDPFKYNFNEELQAQLLTNKASLALRMKDTATAVSLLNKAVDTHPLVFKTRKLMGDIYAGQGNMEKACELWYETAVRTERDISFNANMNLFRYFDSTHQYKHAIVILKRMTSQYESISSDEGLTGIVGAQAQHEIDASKKAHERKLRNIVAASLLLIIITVTTVVYQRRRIRNLNRNYSADMMTYNIVSDRMAALMKKNETDETTIARKTDEIKQLQEKLAEYQDDRRQPDDWNMQEQLMQAPIVTRMHALASRGMEADDTEWKEMYELTRTYLPQLTALLYGTTVINTNEINVCLLIRLRFIPSEIAVLTGTSPQTITNIRSRMLSKLFNEKGGARDFDARIRTIN